MSTTSPSRTESGLMCSTAYVLWIGIASGASLDLRAQPQTYETIERCETAARELQTMKLIRDRMTSAARGNTVFKFDHICLNGASRKQGAE